MVGEKVNERAQEEAIKRKLMASDKELQKEVLPDIRERSRQEYLKKREEQRLEILKRTIEGWLHSCHLSHSLFFQYPNRLFFSQYN